MAEVRVLGVRIEPMTDAPVLLLQEVGGERTLPIFIDKPEAQHIEWALRGQEHARPLTYDLFVEVLGRLHVTVRSVEITAMRQRTYFADLTLDTPAGEQVLSVRPSDGVNLALRTKARIEVAEDVLARHGRYLAADGVTMLPADSADDDEAEELVDELSEWLENVKPEDFG